MKRLLKTLVLSSALFLTMLVSGNVFAQRTEDILDQSISVYAENEPLEDVIRKICEQFNLDFDYNSKLIKGKRVNLSISNKSVKEILEKLMDDFYLIFEIENNLLIVRDYIPMSEHIDFEKLYATPSAGFMFTNPRKRRENINFRQISNLIVIPVSINGSDTMNFILDSGVRDPIITELTLVEKLNLNYIKPIDLRGLGNEMITQAYQSGDNTITLPGLVAEHQKINVIIDENFQISQILGMPVHGLIGMNLFKNYIVRVNYQTEQIRLYKPQYFKYRPRRKDVVLPIHFVRNKPVIRADIMQDSGKVVPVILLIDTGASDALWLSPHANNEIKIPDKHIYSFLGVGLGGELFGYKGRVETLWIGGMPLDNPIVSYPESDYLNNVIRQEQRHGSIGGEVLRRYKIWFDYFNQRLIMRPNNDYRDKFYYNMSGLEIINPVPGLPVFTINNVIEGSPAWEAGFRENDQVIAINFTNHKDLTLNDINLMLRQRKNKKIRMTVLRNGVEFKSEFYLEEIF
ncbi:MAG: aspartyl protease family protein [Prolixibacteraceae bacterium]|nr:aspartyl protease family protein [Prolixibacteraceae bacterium]